ncbi:MAG: tRNA epoxyqueuosine(34) reductase QueG [Rhodospirillaceae bacterium]|nr:tRNA epoxyqueuosine(34) reductase QueG [Rhodospirillales bacterium]MBT3905557.1 tRNA epoxyqueuosine(34) reductase QueG [Rhodospirillaceae bacterium]MBT4702691.1 tRNA epoxyqueuosine(34) reductase QueG [Rhodospirillaceae bacterium]MBT5035969.1 tRNA epoxyqueuosine(34) reductase QueG [Rhodospirillaceae bacterium]MBT6220753.1 tRNA epoxyqueuosine(34) reductase QueG [Rhodospirillaceae bacterium]
METIKQEIREYALNLGFDVVGFAPAVSVPEEKRALDHYVAEGLHGDMGWMADTAERRSDPAALMDDVKTIIVVGMNYGPRNLAPLPSDRGNISVYARGKDYHDILKKRLKRLGRWAGERWDCGIKVFVDTAPVMEKPIAGRAGVGWQGKHTNLVSREFGSWLFLGEMFTSLDLPPDQPPEQPVADHCGSCDACVRACPTEALSGDGQIDPRRCISYLTIEHKGDIEPSLMAGMGNYVYGCDDCLSVCPWNKFALPTQESAFFPRTELTAPRLSDLADLDDAAFRTFFSGSPIKRTGRDRFVRNVLIGIGNSQDKALEPFAQSHLDDPSPLVRKAAGWALERLRDRRGTID